MADWYDIDEVINNGKDAAKLFDGSETGAKFKQIISWLTELKYLREVTKDCASLDEYRKGLEMKNNEE